MAAIQARKRPLVGDGDETALRVVAPPVIRTAENGGSRSTIRGQGRPSVSASIHESAELAVLTTDDQDGQWSSRLGEVVAGRPETTAEAHHDRVTTKKDFLFCRCALLAGVRSRFVLLGTIDLDEFVSIEMPEDLPDQLYLSFVTHRTSRSS